VTRIPLRCQPGKKQYSGFPLSLFDKNLDFASTLVIAGTATGLGLKFHSFSASAFNFFVDESERQANHGVHAIPQCDGQIEMN
jgi:hypothetical protein